MTLQELSIEYRAHALILSGRVEQLQQELTQTQDAVQRDLLIDRIHMLSVMLREAQELAVLTERYYDRRYHRSAKYTI